MSVCTCEYIFVNVIMGGDGCSDEMVISLEDEQPVGLESGSLDAGSHL